MSDNPLAFQQQPDGAWRPYAVPDPAEAARRALELTGIPDIAQGVQALARGELLPGLGQAGSAVAGLLPAGKLLGAAKLGAEALPLAGIIRAWHGTPHVFDPVEHNPFGEFRTSQIGTGEGGQAYGWGHYVAGNPKVAESYKQAGENSFHLDGFPYHSDELDSMSPEQSIGIGALLRFQGEPNMAADWLEGTIRGMKNDPQKYFGGDEPWMQEDIGNHEDALEWLKENHHRVNVPQGSLLEVHILPEEHELLDWDKPLAEQPQLHDKLEPVFKANNIINQDSSIGDFLKAFPSWSGEATYRGLAREISFAKSFSPGDQLASQALHEAGIPGIKYLDQGSRQRRFEIEAPVSPSLNGMRFDSEKEAWDYLHQSGYHIDDRFNVREHPVTSNYVIFDPSNLRIVGRNGQRLEPIEHDPFQDTPR